MAATNLRLIVPGAIVGGLVAFIAALPLAWVAPLVLPRGAGIVWQTARGSIWNGAFEQVRTPFGALNQITIRPARGLSLFSGAPLRVAVQSTGLSAAGWIGAKRLRDMHIEAGLAALTFSDSRLQGLFGTLKLDITDFRFQPACESVMGTVWTDVLRRNADAWHWSGPDLSGRALCDAGDLVLELNGEDNNQHITAALRLRFNGDYRADVTVQTQDVSAQTLLPLFGFAKHQSRFKLVEEGRWAWREK